MVKCRLTLFTDDVRLFLTFAYKVEMKLNANTRDLKRKHKCNQNEQKKKKKKKEKNVGQRLTDWLMIRYSKQNPIWMLACQFLFSCISIMSSFV